MNSNHWKVVLLSIIVMGCAFLLPPMCAKADVITEFGAGVKIPASTSVVLLEDCHVAQVLETRPDDPSLDYRVASCGGDDPLFVGWPVAWERDLGVWSVRTGWFHLSHWFDGGRDREVHLDCACASVKFNWTKWRNSRASR